MRAVFMIWLFRFYVCYEQKQASAITKFPLRLHVEGVAKTFMYMSLAVRRNKLIIGLPIVIYNHFRSFSSGCSTFQANSATGN